MAMMVRKRLRVRGRVQGVGFRPFVYRIASELGMTGHVKNDSDGVLIEVQGSDDAWEKFAVTLKRDAPELAKISSVEIDALIPAPDENQFTIRASDGRQRPTAEILPDVAVCADCLAEMRDPHNRRYGYGLINCTNCGPRYSIIQQIPYDRPNTTMWQFEMCLPCRHEYDDPNDRRFHAQPTACHRCGPCVWLCSADGDDVDIEPYTGAARILESGGIVAVKGVGGFHLAVRADYAQSVNRLRTFKRRNAKPFAVMAKDAETAQRIAIFSEAGLARLISPQAPIVLARRRENAEVCEEVAPGHHRIGVMLAYTPMQHLLFEVMRDVNVLVMTSGNVSDEPLALSNEDALARLGEGRLCDALLLHDRPIERCVDDSVVIDIGDDGALPVRVARGYAPAVLNVSGADTQGIALGGELKNTVALMRGDTLTISQHLGDLKHPLAYDAFKRAIDDLLRLLVIRPRWVAHDMHPGYLSSLHARVMAAQFGAELIAVQHHHAHAAALMAEHRVMGSILALVCDGVGYGTDGTSWGCELLAANRANFVRLGRMRPLNLPGGDASAKDGRRCATALLQMAYGHDWAQQPVCRQLFADPNELTFLQHMMSRGVQIAVSSALGRVYDGFAALLGICPGNTFEGQAAMSLESCAWQLIHEPEYIKMLSQVKAQACVADRDGLLEMNLAWLVRDVLAKKNENESAGQLALYIHVMLAAALEQFIVCGSEKCGLRDVGLTGGVFLNELLTRLLTLRLERRGLNVLRHVELPPNDGGISAGQAVVACAKMCGV